MVAKIKKLVAEEGLPEGRVGCVMWWSASDVHVDPVALRDALGQHAPEYAARVRNPQEPRGAMRRAMRRRQGAAMEVGWRWEEVADGDESMVVALAQAERDAVAVEYRASTRFTVTVDNAGALSASRPPIPDSGEKEALAALASRYSLERGELTQPDVRDFVTKILKEKKAVRLKESGAVYFVPAGSDDVIDRLRPAVAVAGMQFLRFPVMSTDGFSVAQLTGAARAGLAEEAQALRDEAEEKRADVVAGKAARAAALATRLEEVELLRAKARLYRELLSITTEDVDAALRAAEDAVLATKAALDARSKEGA